MVRAEPIPRTRRGGALAAATMVDLAARGPTPQPFAFGQFLSQFVVRAKITAEMPFEAIVRTVARQAAAGKRLSALLLNVRSFEFLAGVGPAAARATAGAFAVGALPCWPGCRTLTCRASSGRRGNPCRCGIISAGRVPPICSP